MLFAFFVIYFLHSFPLLVTRWRHVSDTKTRKLLGLLGFLWLQP